MAVVRTKYDKGPSKDVAHAGISAVGVPAAIHGTKHSADCECFHDKHFDRAYVHSYEGSLLPFLGYMVMVPVSVILSSAKHFKRHATVLLVSRVRLAGALCTNEGAYHLLDAPVGVVTGVGRVAANTHANKRSNKRSPGERPQV